MKNQLTNRQIESGVAQCIGVVLGVLLAGAVHAAPRNQVAVKPADEQTVVVEPAVWMKQLAGRFRIDGAIHHEEVVDFNRLEDVPEGEVAGILMHLNDLSLSIQGKADCTNLGKGPGVQCVVNIAWPETWRPTGIAQLGGVPHLAPAMILAGLAPLTTQGGISFLLVNDKSIANAGSLTLSGNAAVAKPPCVDFPATHQCSQTLRITARSDGSAILMQLGVSVRFQRNKTDRKQFLERIDPDDPTSRLEKATERVEELVDVSLTLKPLSQEETKPASNKGSRP